MSTLWVAHENGSCEFEEPLRKTGIDAKVTMLDSGDFAFQGNGLDDEPLQIGVERKALSDLVTSLTDGRLCGMPTEHGKGGQLQRMRDAYDVIWLLVEGHWLTDKAGRLFVKGKRTNHKLPGAFTEDSLTKRLLSIEVKGRVHVVHTSGQEQTTRWMASLFRWWTDKKWDKHDTMQTVHTRSVMPLSTFREMTLPLPGVGLAGSKALEKQFNGSLTQLLRADITTLSNVQLATPAGPRRLGESRARELQQALNKLR